MRAYRLFTWSLSVVVGLLLASCGGVPPLSDGSGNVRKGGDVAIVDSPGDDFATVTIFVRGDARQKGELNHLLGEAIVKARAAQNPPTNKHVVVLVQAMDPGEGADIASTFLAGIPLQLDDFQAQDVDVAVGSSRVDYSPVQLSEDGSTLVFSVFEDWDKSHLNSADLK